MIIISEMSFSIENSTDLFFKLILLNVSKPLILIPLISDNFISELRKEDLQTLATSLKTLDLSGNSLTSVPEGIFWDLQRLETLEV